MAFAFAKLLKRTREAMRKANNGLWQTLEGREFHVGRGVIHVFTVGNLEKRLIPGDADLVAARAAYQRVQGTQPAQVMFYAPVVRVTESLGADSHVVVVVGDPQNRLVLPPNYTEVVRSHFTAAFLKLGATLDGFEIRNVVCVAVGIAGHQVSA